jgi:hypothetical protein
MMIKFFLVALITAAVILGTYYKDDVLVLFRLSPQQTYKSFFDTDIGRVVELKGGSTDLLNSDSWLRFASPDKITIKYENKYRIMECEKPSEWFVLAAREFTHLRKLEDLVCLELNTADGSKNWFIQNTKSNVYYFRNLKRK